MQWLYFVEVKLIGHYPGKPERFTGKEQLVREEVFKTIYVGFRTDVSWDQKTIILMPKYVLKTPEDHWALTFGYITRFAQQLAISIGRT